MNFLDIIICQYLEDDNIIDNLFSSINKQKFVDFSEIGIILINDCSNVIISDELIKKYSNLNITYLKNDKNVGPGITRQNGVDYSEAKYVTFVDADDELYGDNGLRMVIGCLKDTDADLVAASYIGQRKGNNKLIEKTYEANYTSASLHAKFIKRSFLVENNVRFSDKLSCHFEDSYFSIILTAMKFNEKVTYNINYPIYYWKDNENSITRKKDNIHYYARHFSDFILCPNLVYDFLKDKEPKFAEMFYQNALIDIYVILESDIFNDKSLTKIKKEYEKEFLDLVLKNKNLYYNKTKDDFYKLFLNEKNWYIDYLNIKDNIVNIFDFLNDNNISMTFKED